MVDDGELEVETGALELGSSGLDELELIGVALAGCDDGEKPDGADVPLQ